MIKAGVWAARAIVPRIYDICGANFGDDLNVWSQRCGIDRNDLILANLSYELAQTGSARMFNPFGCTAVALNLPDGEGVLHLRNMDWPLSGCGPATVLVNFEGKCGPFTSVGWPGYVGVLSGIAPGRFSGTINLAPQAGAVTAHWPPSFALRKAFEECATFEDAVKKLSTLKIAASVFFMLTGTKSDEAVVIEHAGRRAKIRRMDRGVLALSNHYLLPEFTKHNPGIKEAERIGFSKERYDTALANAQKVAGNPRTKMLAVLNNKTTCWGLTAQRMAFVPASGWRAVKQRNTDAGVRKKLKG